MALTLRADKGEPLTNAEVDANFVFIDGKADAADSKAVSAQGAASVADAKAVAAQNTANAAIPNSQKGVANGVCDLDSNALIPSARLPSYVDDVLEFADLASFPATGQTGKIYVALDTNKTYRWGGTSYIEISPSPGSTDSVPEGSVNRYFTVARVLATALSGLSVAIGGTIVDTDSILQAFGKIQNQLNLKANLAGAVFTGPVSLPSLNGGQLAGHRNKIINGKMEIAQRGTSISLTASGQYSLDRWVHTWDGSGVTRAVFQQSFPVGTGPENIKNFLSYAQSVAGSGGTFNAIEHRIEGVDNFSGQTVTLSFYARNNAATPLPQIICRQFFGTGGSATVNTTVATNVATSASFTRYTYTFTVPSIVGRTVAGGNDYLSILILLPINSVFTFDLTGVQLEVGPIATPFEHRSHGVELQLCWRYYQAHGKYRGSMYAAGLSSMNTPFPIPIPMRATPSVVLGAASVFSNATNIGLITESFNSAYWKWDSLAAGQSYWAIDSTALSAEL